MEKTGGIAMKYGIYFAYWEKEWAAEQIRYISKVKKLGFDIDRKIIVVKDVKEVGSYHATVKLHKEVSVEIPFEVVAEEA